MPLYETVIIARQDISTQQVEALADQMSGFITDGGGEIAKTEHWGLRNLAYKIKKNRKGHYVLMNIDAPVPAVKEMERNLLLHEDILRYMTLRVDELEEGESVMLQSRNARTTNRRDRDDEGEAETSEPVAETATTETVVEEEVTVEGEE